MVRETLRLLEQGKVGFEASVMDVLWGICIPLNGDHLIVPAMDTFKQKPSSANTTI